MQLTKKVFCDGSRVTLVPEKIIRSNGYTLSITSGGKKETMVFLGTRKKSAGYEVRVYKNNSDAKYIPHELDNIQAYEENNEFATFIFDNYVAANNFTSSLEYRHKEFMPRPMSLQSV